MTLTDKKEAEYQVIVSHISDLLTQDLILTGIHRHCRFTDYGLSFDFPNIKYVHKTGDILYPTWQIEELKNAEISLETFRKIIAFLEEECTDYGFYLKEFEEQIKTSEEKEKKIIEYFRRSMKMAGTVPYFMFEQKLQEVLKQKKIPAHVIPASVTDITQAFLDLEGIAAKHKKHLGRLKKKKDNEISEFLKQDLHRFCEKYAYLGMKYFKGKPWTIPEAFRMLFSVDRRKKIKKRRIKDPHVDIAAQILRLRTIKWELMCKGTYLFRKYIINHFSQEFAYTDLLKMRLNEILGMLQRQLPIDEIDDRKLFIMNLGREGVRLLPDYEDKIERTEKSMIEEIRGQCAQPGKVVGRVKVCLTPEECKKVNRGDILVTKMSTPDFLPAMRKAAAFITDIGGITSHAAIISREMGKPCIIDTKIATKALRDGDLVKVDAEKGTIKKV